MQGPAYIYALRDPRTNDIKYVGQTTRTLEKRVGEHIRHAKVYRHRTANWIKKLAKLSLKPTIELLEEVSLENIDERESYWITHYRELGIDLLNHTDGGEGVAGFKWSEESKRKQSERKQGIGFKLTEKNVLDIYDLMRKGKGNKEIAVMYGLTRQYVRQLRYGLTWSHIYPTDIPPAPKRQGEKINSAKLGEKAVLKIHKLLAEGQMTHAEIAKQFDVSRPVVTRIASGKRWAHLHPANRKVTN